MLRARAMRLRNLALSVACWCSLWGLRGSGFPGLRICLFTYSWAQQLFHSSSVNKWVIFIYIYIFNKFMINHNVLYTFYVTRFHITRKWCHAGIDYSVLNCMITLFGKLWFYVLNCLFLALQHPDTFGVKRYMYKPNANWVPTNKKATAVVYI